MPDLYKASGDSGFTLYAATDENIYCQVHYPSGDIGDVHKLDNSWSVGRIVGQLGATEVESFDTANEWKALSQ